MLCSQKKRTLQSFGGTLYNCVLDPTKLYNRHYKIMYSTNLGASAIQTWSRAHTFKCWSKVTRVTKSDTPSFFIPQPPPPQQPATTSPTRNTQHHERPWPSTNHDNRLTTKHDHHRPTSPASMTPSAPSTSTAATSRNPHHEQTQPVNRRQPPNRQPHAKEMASGNQRPAPNERHRPPSNHPQWLPNDQRPRTTTRLGHGRQRYAHPCPQRHEWLNGRAGACTRRRLMRDDDNNNNVVVIIVLSSTW